MSAREAANDLPDSVSPDGNGLVGHDLRANAQSVFGRGQDRETEVGRIDDFGGHLTDHDRGVSCRKGVGLDDDGGTRLAIISGRCDHDDIAAFHSPFASDASNSETASRKLKASDS